MNMSMQYAPWIMDAPPKYQINFCHLLCFMLCEFAVELLHISLLHFYLFPFAEPALSYVFPVFHIYVVEKYAEKIQTNCEDLLSRLMHYIESILALRSFYIEWVIETGL